MKKSVMMFIANNGKLNAEIAIKVLAEKLDEREMENFMSYAYDMEKIPEVAEISNVNDDALNDCRKLTVNYLSDTVRYEYEKNITRYFETEEAKKEWEGGKGSYWSGENKCSDKYSWKATRVEKSESTWYGIQEWNEKSK